MAALGVATGPTAIKTSRNHSPLSSATGTPVNQSPTSPRHSQGFTSPSVPSRQLRPPKCPLYVPAVLRPTERPQPGNLKRDSHTKNPSLPITPPYSAGSSFDEASSAESLDSISRRMLGEIGHLTGVTRVITDEWVDEEMEDVTGYPTRDHWKPDASSPTCNAPVCGENFNMFVRRHHCRRCGNIFCASHSTRVVPLDQHARFHPKGAQGRACETCFADFQTWNRARKRSRNDSGTGSVAGSSSASSESGGSGTSTPTAIKGAEHMAGDSSAAAAAGADSKTATPVVGSLSRDWNWSTF